MYHPCRMIFNSRILLYLFISIIETLLVRQFFHIGNKNKKKFPIIRSVFRQNGLTKIIQIIDREVYFYIYSLDIEFLIY